MCLCPIERYCLSMANSKPHMANRFFNQGVKWPVGIFPKNEHCSGVGNGGSKNQTDTLRKLQACKSLLKSSVWSIFRQCCQEGYASCHAPFAFHFALVFPLTATFQHSSKVNVQRLCLSSSDEMCIFLI